MFMFSLIYLYLQASKWTHTAEKLLLAQQKDLDESKVHIKNKWKKISDKIQSKSYNFTAEQCRLKVKIIQEK